jgi:phage terminase large subunit-like protein
MRWYTNNTKKIESNGNMTYGKIEPNYRKTDGFMALVNAMIISDELPEDFEVVFMDPIVF